MTPTPPHPDAELEARDYWSDEYWAGHPLMERAARAEAALADMTAQRDATRAKLVDLDIRYDRALDERDAAEARGYQRGLDRAAEICHARARGFAELAAQQKKKEPEVHFFGRSSGAENCAAAIRAEQPK